MVQTKGRNDGAPILRIPVTILNKDVSLHEYVMFHSILPAASGWDLGYRYLKFLNDEPMVAI